MSVLDTFHKLMLARQAGANPMSMIRCDGCGHSIDTDFDVECDVLVPWKNLAPAILCKACREREWEENDQREYEAERNAL